jgi:hypothetical protein
MTSVSVEQQICAREKTHITNLQRFEAAVMQHTQSIEHQKTAFANQFNFHSASKAAEHLAKQCDIFMNEIETIRSNAMCEVDGVLFEFATPDGVTHKAMSKIVQKRKTRIEERVADLTRLTTQLQTSMSFVQHLRSFDIALESEQSELTAMAGKKVCPFCNESVAIPDWLVHAKERHAKEERMTTTDSERETFDKKNAKDEFQRSQRRRSPSSGSGNGMKGQYNGGGGGGGGDGGSGGRSGGSGGRSGGTSNGFTNNGYQPTQSTPHSRSHPQPPHTSFYNGSTPMAAPTGTSTSNTAPFNRRRSVS